MEEQDSMEERMTKTSMEENICYSTLTSFLQNDTSFLTPWSWDPNASENEASAFTKEKQYLHLPPGSYFSYSIIRWLKRKKKPRYYDYLRKELESRRKIKEIKAMLKKKLSLLYEFSHAG